MQISRRAINAAQAQGFGKRLAGNAGRLVAHQFFARQQQQLGVDFGGLAVPGFKTEAAAHLGRQLLVVIGKNQLVIDQHILPTRLVLQVFHLFDQLLVGGQKRQPGVPLASHQRLADKNFARPSQVNPAVVDAPAAVNHDAIQRGALQRVDFGRFFLPMRVEQLLL